MNQNELDENNKYNINDTDTFDYIIGRVSIIVPVYCIKMEYLNCCVESLVKQTYSNVEIILIDDGSPDNSGELCDAYADQYTNVKVIHQQNQGVSVARNRGVSESSGEYIMFVDSDDWLETDCVEHVIYEIEKHKVDLLYFQYCEERGSGTKYFGQKQTREIDKFELRQIQIDMISASDKYGYGMKPPWGKLIRRSVIIENNVIFPPGLKKSQDVVFNLYLLEYIKKAYISDFVGYHYRIYDESISYRYNSEAPEIMINILQEYSKFVLAYHKSDRQYKTSLGVRAFVSVGVMARIYLFHPESQLTEEEIINIIKNYLNNELVKAYAGCCKMNDFPGRRKKLEYILLKGKHYKIYYAYRNILKYKSENLSY